MLIHGLAPIWPATRTKLNGVSLGDVWPCEVLKTSGAGGDDLDNLVPFHKLTQVRINIACSINACIHACMCAAWPTDLLDLTRQRHGITLSSQWLCYSLMEPIEQTLGCAFIGGEHQTVSFS